MLFNSLSFGIFLPIVFLIYWFVTKTLKLQNAFLLLASYFFYGCWDWRFLFLLLFSTLLDYYSGIKIEEADKTKTKRFWFWLSIIVNLGFLGVFKYFNFFSESLTDVLSMIGWQVNPVLINIILPVGISFYTFHGLSYVIDIYNGKIRSERGFVNYAVFVSFFPLLVAGPIERATHLLPQIKKERTFDYHRAVDGLRQILWGLFKKIVIADNCAVYADQMFNHPGDVSGSSLALGAILFAFQIYGDFSGYSDIALGVARIFGIELLQNFSSPYFSRDIAEFWRRWHISLSSWFKDYLYIPLGGSRGSNWLRIKNTFIIFLISGFWHGANWTYIVWGALHALFIMPSIIFKTNRQNLEIVSKGQMIPTLREIVEMVTTFILVVFAWIFFRAKSLSDAIEYIQGIFTQTFFSVPYVIEEDSGLQILPLKFFLILFIFILIEWLGREDKYALEKTGIAWLRWQRILFYYILVLLIFLMGGKDQQFIYFQF
jgi:alginate O-acetyltransferase complex protein AlgI